MVEPDDLLLLPEWLQPVARAAGSITGDQLSRFVANGREGRRSAVLILFGEGPAGPDLLIIERAAEMRSHAGQPAFPGGMLDEGETPIQAALREAEEETGLDSSGVEVFAELPDLWLPPSQFIVTPVLGWWRSPSSVGVVDPGEVALVERVPVSELVDPANRVSVQHPSGFVGPGFTVRGMLIWGFTGGLLSRLLALVGWEQPWDASRVVRLEDS